MHITNCFHPTSGGIRTFYLALLEGANRLQRPMRLVVPGAENRVDNVGQHGRIYQVKAPRTPFFDRRYRLILPHSFAWPNGNGLRHILQAEKPDLVEVCDKYSVCWIAGVLRKGWIPGVPRPTLVGTSCERMDDNVSSYITSAGVARRLAAAYIRDIYAPLFDFHIAVSRYVAEELIGASPELAERVSVLPMGVHIERFGPQYRDLELRRRLQSESGGDAGTALLLYAGRLSPEKNVHLLTGMLKLLENSSFGLTGAGGPRDIRMLVAGSGPLEGWLKEQTRYFGGRLRMLGHLKNAAELARLLASVDVFVHPNPREPFGIGPLEAMASGTPILVPDQGGVTEYADSSCAWQAKPTAPDFARAVLAILSDRRQACNRAAAARTVAERHPWDKIAQRFFETYDTLDAERKTSGAGSPLGKRRAAVVRQFSGLETHSSA